VWCDTRYSWSAGGGREVTLEALLAEVKAGGAENVVVTGGEPLEHPAFVPVIAGLRHLGRRVEVETAGTRVPPAVDVDQWNVSVKLAHSGVPAARRLCPEAIRRFRDLGAWFKFVVGAEGDVDEVLDIQARHGLPGARIVLMPLGMRRDEQQARMLQVVDWCRAHGFRFSPRLHILLWGPKRGV
jgi:organic radical activating enzyme